MLAPQLISASTRFSARAEAIPPPGVVTKRLAAALPSALPGARGLGRGLACGVAVAPWTRGLAAAAVGVLPGVLAPTRGVPTGVVAPRAEICAELPPTTAGFCGVCPPCTCGAAARERSGPRAALRARVPKPSEMRVSGASTSSANVIARTGVDSVAGMVCV